MKSLSRVRLLATPWTAAHQAPPSMGFSRQDYWSGVPLPSPNSISSQQYLIFNIFIYFICLSPRHIHILEKAMTPHSSTFAWEIPWMEEPGRLQSMGSLRVRYNWGTSLWLFTFMHWRRKWQPTPVFLPKESQGWWSLVSCCLRSCTELDTTEAT